MHLTSFIEQHQGQQRQLLLYLHEWFTAELRLQAKMRYKIPFYYQKSWVCYLNPLKKGGLELAFLRGNELQNQAGLLDSKGRKQVAGIDLHHLDDLPHQALQEILQEALLLDGQVPYASKRKG